MEPCSASGGAGRRTSLLVALAGLVPDMQRRALALDPGSDFPAQDLDLLRNLGALAAPVPERLGGLGMGTEATGAVALMEALRLIGRGSLSVGRIYEAHVNALRLAARYGTVAQGRRAADDALGGHLFALWVTDAPDAPLGVTPEGRLCGAKVPCSGAGHATRALLTALFSSGERRMVLVAVGPEARIDLSGWDAHGMRPTQSGRVTFDGVRVGPDAVIGGPGDYLREPDFSGGAWRTSAVTLGGLEALVAELRALLLARGRTGDPHQRARVGEALIAQETARLWVHRAALLAEADERDTGDTAYTVNLARIAAETAALDAIRIVQRALGLAAFRRGELVELLMRDLAVYLRQPAPDETLAEAANYFIDRDLPRLPTCT